MIMYLIGKRLCPACGVRGSAWRKEPEVFVCPSCKTFFNEFGVVLESMIEKENVMT
jgi:Zn-finger nucleic acid-binding protein